MQTATAKIPSMVTFNRDHLTAKFSRGLLVDDDIDYGRSISQNLSSIGITINVVGSLSAAVQELATQQYPIVFFDNIFDDRPEIKGSEFIRDESSLLRNSEIILMTGYAVNQIVDDKELERRGVRIVRKAPGHIEEIKRICREIVDSNVDRFSAKIEEFCSRVVDRVHAVSDIEALIPEPQLLQRARTYLFEYIAHMPNQDLEQFYFGGQSYTPRQLANEVAQGSRTGAVLLEQFLDDVLDGPEAVGRDADANI